MRQQLSNRYVPPTVVLCLGLFLTLLLCVLWQRYSYHARVQAEFERRAMMLANVLHNKLTPLVEALENIGALYASSQEVERGEFEQFILSAVKKHPAIQGLNWVPRVPEALRATFEMSAQAEGITNFQFTERTPAGEFVRAGQRAEYFPVYFVAPLVGKEAALGFDLASHPVQRAVLERARDTGQMAATPPLTLLQGMGQHIGVLIFLPIYANGAPTDTLAERRINLQGLGMLAVRLDVAIQDALHGWDRSGLALSVADDAAPPGEDLLYREEPSTPADTLRWVHTFPIADRRWRFEFSFLPASAPWTPRSLPTVGTILAVGCSLTVLLSGYLFTSASRSSRLAQAAQALAESELRFRQLAEHIHEVFYLFEVESSQMLYISPAYERIWGRSAQALYQQATDFIEAVHPEDRQTIYATLDQHTRGENTAATYRIVRPDGEVRWILDRAFPFRDSAQSGYRVAGVAEDITERKQAEEALRQMNDVLEQRVAERTAALRAANAELAKATRLKDEFLASMSHELRTPLNAILGLSEALQEQVYGPLTEKQDQSLRRIEESGRHLLALITDILDLSKIEAGKVELNVTPVDVEGVCQASLRLIRESAHKKHLQVTTRVDQAVSTLLADERLLKQMLVNLLSNAVKFTPAEGSIGLEVTGHGDEQMVSFTVWDTGIGITDADRERLFQPFVQLDSSLARHHAGTGLGLSLVARLTALHGGRVTLESTVGQGSRFSIVLPWRVNTQDRKTEERTEAPAFSPALPMARLERVIVVEDTPTHAEQLVRYLQDLAVNVTVYPRAEGVVDYVVALYPDVILLDLELPQGSGWDVLAQLKTEPQTRAIPVVIVSVIDEQAQGLARGAAAYLVKPVSREQLQTTVRQVIASQQRPLPASVVTTQSVASGSGPLLLLAEDNEMNVTTVGDYLSAKGYRLAVAGNGAEALAQARVLHPSLILMDIQMPGMDGLEATRRLRAETDTRLAATPIIALTALAMPGDRERCLAAGANAYLTKPVSLHDLLQAIDTQLKG